MKRILEWGESPWDRMERADLLREVQRLHSAAESALSVLEAIRDRGHRYWGPLGNGGLALEKCRQATKAVREGFEDSNLFRAFYRYACDLLFDAPIGYGWRICEQGHMTGSNDEWRMSCGVCRKDVRPLRWDDLSPARARPVS